MQPVHARDADKSTRIRIRSGLVLRFVGVQLRQWICGADRTEAPSPYKITLSSLRVWSDRENYTGDDSCLVYNHKQ